MVATAPASRGNAADPARQVDDALLDAARRTLERHGLARATLERISEQAGLSRVTLYRRGLTREAILAALADGILDTYRRALWPALTDRGTGADRLRRALAAVCEVAEENLELLLALGERVGTGLGGSPGEREASARHALTEPLERLLRDGEADGSLRGDDPRETATGLLHLAVWTYAHLRTGPRWSARRARRVTVELALHGVPAPETPGPE
jgi:AcrR family transcriptional regulator